MTTTAPGASTSSPAGTGASGSTGTAGSTGEGPAVRVEVRAPVAVLTLDRARRRNPLSVATMRELTAALRDVATHDGVRAIVVRAEGPAFSAGHDLSEMVERTLDEEREVFAVCTEMMQAVHQVPQPVIAAIQGVAVAAGCQLVATCDLAVAAEGAVFGTPGVKIGLFCSTPMVAVSRAIGRKRAMQLLLTGEVIDAATAADWGLVNEVVPADRLDARALELAEKVADASAATLAIGKEAFYRQIDLSEDDAYAAMSETMATNAVTCDAQEGMSAFLAKRPPVWQGR
jgi:enoyl-CoA hydratase/carnithine racemase